MDMNKLHSVEVDSAHVGQVLTIYLFSSLSCWCIFLNAVIILSFINALNEWRWIVSLDVVLNNKQANFNKLFYIMVMLGSINPGRSCQADRFI